MTELSINPEYKDLLKEVKSKILSAQVKALVQVNQTLMLLYWEIGKLIMERQEKQGR